MEKRSIGFSPPDISEAEIEEVVQVLRSGWITTGPRTKELEKRIAEYCNTKRAACLSSATAAEELNLRVLGIGQGDQVIVTAYTYSATAAAVIHTGAELVFVDTQPDSLEMDYEAVEAAINAKTKAIVAVDVAGIPVDYERLYEIVERKRGLFTPGGDSPLSMRIQRALGRVAVLADAAHSLGATRNGKKSGELADFTSFSFHAVKNLTTAEGGASTFRTIPGIDDEEIYKQFMLYSLHGQSKDAFSKAKLGAWEYDIVGPWYKFNMTDIAAALGLIQLDRYPGLLARRRELIGKYDSMCQELGLWHLDHYTASYSSSGHLYPVRVPGADDQKRRELMVRLADRGVPTNVHYKPLPMMTAYKNLGWDIKDFPNAYSCYENLITLPLHTLLSDEDMDFIIETVKEVIQNA